MSSFLRFLTDAGNSMGSVVKRLLKQEQSKTAVRETPSSSTQVAAAPAKEDSGQEILLPPMEVRIPVRSDEEFIRMGNLFLRYFRDLAGLRPDETVLDVGCGAGRIARPLMGFLSDKAEYWAFDINRNMIQWCIDNISARRPNFHFEVSDIFNSRYNQGGKFKPGEFIFPYPDDKFDFVFLTSVFTHMLPDDVDHYFSELARVVKPGGRTFITYFLLNEESRACIAAGKSKPTFGFKLDDRDDCLISKPNTPEGSIAYDETFVMELYRKHGFEVRQPLYYGSWCGREGGKDNQDIVVASRI